MKDIKKSKNSDTRRYRNRLIIGALILLVSLAGVYLFLNQEEELKALEEDAVSTNDIKNGIHIATGFIEAPGMQETITNCTACHSAQLVIQNRMNKERWHSTIDWMQKTQNLWDLGANEEIIVNYLVKNYPPVSKGRREILTNIEWYELKE